MCLIQLPNKYPSVIGMAWVTLSPLFPCQSTDYPLTCLEVQDAAKITTACTGMYKPGTLVHQYILCFLEYSVEVQSKKKKKWSSNSALKYLKIISCVNLSVKSHSSTMPWWIGHFFTSEGFSFTSSPMKKARSSTPFIIFLWACSPAFAGPYVTLCHSPPHRLTVVSPSSLSPAPVAVTVCPVLFRARDGQWEMTGSIWPSTASHPLCEKWGAEPGSRSNKPEISRLGQWLPLPQPRQAGCPGSL